MGKFSKGILGGFSGRVGTVVGANWRGLDIMRSLPKKSDRPATESQLLVRATFTLVTRFLAPIRPIVAAFFGQPQGFKSRRNLATAYHISEAVTGVYPDLAIDYQRVMLTKGELLNAENAIATPQANAEIEFIWTDNSGQGVSLATDGLLVVVYNETRKAFEVREQAALRSALSYTLGLPQSWASETVQVWISFISDDAKKCANSVYAGEFVLTA
jgi:hypothetical protein